MLKLQWGAAHEGSFPRRPEEANEFMSAFSRLVWIAMALCHQAV